MLEKSCRWWPIWYLLLFCHGAEGISTIISYNYWLLMYSFPYTQRNTPLLLSYFPYTQGNSAWCGLLFSRHRKMQFHFLMVFHTNKGIHPICLIISHTPRGIWLHVVYYIPHTQGKTVSFVCCGFPSTQGNTSHLC